MEAAKRYDEVAVYAANAKRQESRILVLRNFNNWIKACLIDEYGPDNASIFELACGKSGEIYKWKEKKPCDIVFADVSDKSFFPLYEKVLKTNINTTETTFISGDMFTYRIDEIVPQKSYDITSCQFALHYSFENPQKAETAIHNLTCKLRPGGYILLTIPNACRIVKQFRTAQEKGTSIVQNSIFAMERKFDLEKIPPFGAAYDFELIESVNRCTEYLIHPEVLIHLFRTHKAHFVQCTPFHDFYVKALRTPGARRDSFQQKMRKNLMMTKEEWEVISLYTVFIFQKDGAPPPKDNRQVSGQIRDPDKFYVIDAATQEPVLHSLAEWERSVRK